MSRTYAVVYIVPDPPDELEQCVGGRYFPSVYIWVPLTQTENARSSTMWKRVLGIIIRRAISWGGPVRGLGREKKTSIKF